MVTTPSVEETLTHKLSGKEPATATHRQILVVGESGTTTFRVPASGSVAIGRTTECPIRLSDGHASRHHATLHFGEHVTIVDHGSTNGTHVGEVRITPEQHTVVAPGVVVRIGVSTLVIQSSAPSPRPRHLRTHGYFEARLEEECLRAEATASTFAVVRLRCDALGAKLAEEGFARWLRPMDVVAIYAPSEYELLLPEMTPASADAVCRPIEASLKQRGAAVEMSVACYPLDGRSPERLVARAGAVSSGPAPRSSSTSVVQQGAMKRLAPIVERVAAGNISTLILGETGVGKEVLATSIHRMSPRSSGPLLCLNCAAFTETLLESELFGHERGAFTGAVSSKQGLLESASGGTVFLDEIGEMPAGLQARLLRVIEQRQVLRIGAVRPRPIDVRFIAATNRDLEAEITRGTFRQDLYFRLNGVTLYVPPLRERVDEIETLATEFIRHFAAEAGRSVPPRLSREALALLEVYGWPGNIRELRNVIERAVLLSSDDEITVAHLPGEKMGRALPVSIVDASHPDMHRPVTVSAGAPIPESAARLTIPDHESNLINATPQAFAPSSAAREDAERLRIIRALEECAGNQTQAARLLGMSRGTLISRLELYALPRPRRTPV
jgi:transcriptional regulator with GAF, ATPase, and Fis domain